MSRIQRRAFGIIDEAAQRCQNTPSMEPASRGPQTGVLYDLACEFAAQLELDQLVPLIVNKCREVLDVEGVSVFLLDRERGELYVPYNSQMNPEVAATLTGVRFAADRGIVGSVLKSGRSERIDDPGHDPRHYSGVDTRSGVTTRSILAVPLVARGEPVGVIEAVNHRDGPFRDDDFSCSNLSPR